MSSPPCRIRRRGLPDGVKFVFPWRELPPPLRWPVRAGAVFSLLGLGLALALAALSREAESPLRELMRGGAVIAAIPSLAFLGFALCHAWTWTVIAIRADGITVTEWLGPVPRRRRRSWHNIERLRTHYVIHSTEEASGPPTDRGLIELVGRGAQSLFVAHDYPRDWLLPIAAEIAARGRLAHDILPFDSEITHVPAFLFSPVEDEDSIDCEERPASALTTVERQPDGFRVLALPRPGWLGPWTGWAVMLLAAAAFIAAMIIIGAVPQGQPVRRHVSYLVFASGVFTMQAIGLLRRQRTSLVYVEAERLFIATRAPLRRTVTEIVDRTAVAAVRSRRESEESETRGSHAVIAELHDRTCVRLLRERDQDEARWLATLLRRELGVPAVPAQPAAS